MQAQLDNKYSSIRAATYGIAFFATPHQGGNHARLGEIAARIVRLTLHNPKNTFMESLKGDELFSDLLVQNFRHQLESYYVLSFFETRPFKKIGLVRMFIPQIINLANICRLLIRNLQLLVSPVLGKHRLRWTQITQASANSKALMEMPMSKFRETLFISSTVQWMLLETGWVWRH